MKFSPKSKLLAIGANDTEIFIYSCKKKFKVVCKIRAHNAPIKHMDFTTDGKIL